VGAFLVIADTVGVPIGFFHQLLEGFGIAFAEEIAGSLPAEHGTRRITPRRATIGLIAREEIEEHGGLAEGPALAALAARENPPEEILGLLAIEEMLLVGRAFIGIARRYGDAIKAQSVHVVEEFGHAVGFGGIEQRAVDADAEAFRFGELDRFDGLFVDALLAHRLVVHVLVAIEMDGPVEVLVRTILVDLLGQQQRIRAENDDLPTLQKSAHDLGHFAVEQRLAASDRDHGRAALVHGLHAVVDAEALIEDFVGVIDLAAAGASKIATEQRLQHEYERIAFAPDHMLLQHVRADTHRLSNWNSHSCSSLKIRRRTTDQLLNSAGNRNSMFSLMPSISDTSMSPSIRRSASITSSTSFSGAEAPAVKPTVSLPAIQAGSSSLPSAMR